MIKKKRTKEKKKKKEKKVEKKKMSICKEPEENVLDDLGKVINHNKGFFQKNQM